MLLAQIGVIEMANFNPAMIVPASKSTEFAVTEQGRTPKTILLDGITKQLKLYKEPKVEGRRWFTVGAKEIALTLRIGNKPLKLAGDETKVVVPADQFEAAMKHFEGEVKAGKFDAELKAAEKAMDDRRTKLRSTRAKKAAEANKPA